MFNPKRTMFIILVVALTAIAPFVVAQETKQSPTGSGQVDDSTHRAEREAMYYRYLNFASYVKGGSITPHWMADGSSFWYTEGASDNTVIWKVDPKANTKKLLFDTLRLRQSLRKVLGHEPPYRGLPFSDFSFVDGGQAVKFGVEAKEFVLHLDTYTITPVPVSSEEGKERVTPKRGEVPSPDGRWIATVKEYNLWLRPTGDGREVQLTNDGVKDYEWTLGASPASGQNMAVWSSDSYSLAATKVDYRQVPKIPLIEWLGSKEAVEWVHFPRKPGLPTPR
ncbi:MAG: DPP IV N-terminal domain-containing protein, partial [Acidobacteria bacterium]|nr:DPP IV N-terminal domain-containing protein [Acidobacteriota bacterium]